MVHAYHVVFSAYGFWLPNDPRGSWSDFVASWELVRFGEVKSPNGNKTLTSEEKRQKEAAKKALKYQPVEFTGEQARAIGQGFANAVTKSGYTIWACSILPQHVHMVIARHSYKIEQVVNLLKSEATKQLTKEGIHPLAVYAKEGERAPKPWTRKHWQAYLDSEKAIDNAIRYTDENPEKEGKPAQKWHFVVPFEGLESAFVTYQ